MNAIHAIAWGSTTFSLMRERLSISRSARQRLRRNFQKILLRRRRPNGCRPIQSKSYLMTPLKLTRQRRRRSTIAPHSSIPRTLRICLILTPAGSPCLRRPLFPVRDLSRKLSATSLVGNSTGAALWR